MKQQYLFISPPLNQHDYLSQKKKCRSGISILFTGCFLFKIIAGILLFYTMVAGGAVYGQHNKDSVATGYMNSLSRMYLNGSLSEERFIDTVNATMELLLSRDIHLPNSKLLELLGTYRKVIWKRQNNEKLKQDYYSILNNQAKNAGRLGEMLYYAEKINELEQKRHNQPSITSLTFMADYYNNNSAYRNTQALYREHKAFIASLPRLVAAHKVDRKDLKRIGNMLNYFVIAAFKNNNSVSGSEILDIIDRIVEIIKTKYGSESEMIAEIRYVQLLALYEKAVTMTDTFLIWNTILGLERLAADKATPEYLKNYIDFAATDRKIVYFLESGNTDSATHYLNVFNTLYNKKDNPFNNYMIKKYTARSLYNRGLYRQSVDSLRAAIVIIEKLRSTSVTEINDMMYALAKVEEQQLVLEEAKEQQQKTDQQLFYAGISLAVLLLGGLYTFRAVRYRQVKKFLEFKLNLARNIHDEANPALLYAKTLARTERMNSGLQDKTALEHHIEDTMELLRSLSHDLKSDRQHSIQELLKETGGLLQKLNPDNEFSYKIRKNNDDQLFLSHFQYTQLSAILKECISNTLKHADFRNIDIELLQDNNSISIIYRDDGSGWPRELAAKGMGLENMEARARKMNAGFLLKNYYPEGYFMKIAFKLH